MTSLNMLEAGTVRAIRGARADVRLGLKADLRFSPQDRVENIRRVGEVTNRFLDAGRVVVVAPTFSHRADRQRAKGRIEGMSQ